MSDTYDYCSRPITIERRGEIVDIIDSLRNDAADDIEDKRAIYEALVDLFNAAHITYHEE